MGLNLPQVIRDRVLGEVNLVAIGNSKRHMKDVAIDLINASRLSYKEIAAGTFLHQSTIRNLATEKTRNPQVETIERVYRFFGTKMHLSGISLAAEFRNEPKERSRGSTTR